MIDNTPPFFFVSSMFNVFLGGNVSVMKYIHYCHTFQVFRTLEQTTSVRITIVHFIYQLSAERNVSAWLYLLMCLRFQYAFLSIPLVP